MFITLSPKNIVYKLLSSSKTLMYSKFTNLLYFCWFLNCGRLLFQENLKKLSIICFPKTKKKTSHFKNQRYIRIFTSLYIFWAISKYLFLYFLYFSSAANAPSRLLTLPVGCQPSHSAANTTNQLPTLPVGFQHSWWADLLLHTTLSWPLLPPPRQRGRGVAVC